MRYLYTLYKICLYILYTNILYIYISHYNVSEIKLDIFIYYIQQIIYMLYTIYYIYLSHISNINEISYFKDISNCISKRLLSFSLKKAL
jgi:hypothetical protein